MKQTRNGGPKFEADRVLAVGLAMKKLGDELADIFPERKHLIQQILFALATRKNVLIYGTHGTGKTDLVHTLFGAFTGDPAIFSAALDKFMTFTNLFGVPDMKKMREESRIVYPLEGLLTADLAELDEILDANDAVLRTLLGVLNERQFKRGRQVERVKLHTAVASTNAIPEEEIKRRPGLAAVLDRFIFHANVVYLKDRDSRLRMYGKYLGGELPDTKVPFEDLQYLSGIVVQANQITDPAFISTYDELIEGYQKEAKKVISDRRKCKLLECVEAEALFNGRYAVHPEDLLAVRWGACVAGNEPEHEAFKKVSGPIVEKAVKEMQSPIDSAEVELLKKLSAESPDVPKDVATAEVKVEAVRTYTRLKKQVGAVKPQLQTTRDLQAGILRELEKRVAAAQAVIAGVK